MSKQKKQNKKIKVICFLDRIINSSLLSKVSVVALISMVYAIMNYVYVALHQIDCEQHYKIPSFYFSTSINYSLLYIGAIALVVGVCFYYPRVLRKAEIESGTTWNKAELAFYSTMLGLLYGVTNWSILEGVVTESYSKSDPIGFFSRLIIENIWISFFLVLALSLLAILLWAFFDVDRRNRNKRRKWLNGAAIALGIISLIISALGIFSRFNSKAEDKRNYEFITHNSSEYVVLSEYDGNALVVPFEVTVNSEGEKYKFMTKEYRLIPKTDGVLKYKQLTCAPEIE